MGLEIQKTNFSGYFGIPSALSTDGLDPGGLIQFLHYSNTEKLEEQGLFCRISAGFIER